jgi:phage tail-like protein
MSSTGKRLGRSLPRPNGYDRYWFLDHIAGWREAFSQGLELTEPDGNLVLDPLPGAASLLLDAEIQAAEFTCPSALATDGCGHVFVVDAATNLVKRIDLQRGSVETLPAMGGKGSGPREFREPRGIAVLPTGGMVVSDTGNHHIKIFLPPVYALVQDWGATDKLDQPRPDDGRKMFRWPWDVAVDDCSAVYIVDRGNRRIQKISADGTWQNEFAKETFINPIRIAVGSEGVVGVVDAGSDQIIVIASGIRRSLSGIDKPRSIAIGTNGKIYVGDAEGLIHLFELDAKAENGYRNIGSGSTGFSGEIVDLVWDDKYGLLAIVAEKFSGRRQRLWKIDPKGAPVSIGRFITQALDSKIPNCQWHRVLLNAQVPGGTSIQIDSFTKETIDTDDRDSVVTDPDFNQWKFCVKAGDSNPDCLVQSGTGRYLWLRLTLNSNGLDSPELRSLKAFYPRTSYLQYLPAVYQEDEDSRQFLERFLSIFQSEFDEFDRRIDRFWELFNPGSTPAKDLQWLAGWLALVINPAWSEAKLRSMIKDAFQAYLQRGTLAGLQQTIRDYVGVEASIVEHFRLRRLPLLSIAGSVEGGVRLWSPDFYKRLQLNSNSQIGSFQLISKPEPEVEALNWGAHQFTVFFAANPYGFDDSELQVTQVVEREKPAHTQHTICPVFPRFRVGVQATIGTDSVVGGISYLVLNRLSTLGYDSILGCSQQEQKLRGLGLTPRPTVSRSSLLS